MVDDLISRQAALDAISAWRRDYPLDLQEPIDDCWNSARELPAVQLDHVADVSKKVEQTGETAQNVQNEDLISRKWLVECIEEGWVKFDTAKDCNRMMHLVRDIAPSVQPEQNAQDEDLIFRKAAIDAVIDEFKRSPTPAIRAKLRLEALPPAQPEQRWIPVTERLPENDNEVLITVWDAEDDYVEVYKGFYQGHEWWTQWCHGCSKIKDEPCGENIVIAWMPLPEPYRGGDAE